MSALETKCPSCDAHMTLPNDVINGEIVGCPDCGVEYEVTGTNKDDIKLRLAEIEGEDWGE